MRQQVEVTHHCRFGMRGQYVVRGIFFGDFLSLCVRLVLVIRLTTKIRDSSTTSSKKREDDIKYSKNNTPSANVGHYMTY